MKNVIKVFIIAILFSGVAVMAQAQKKSGKLEVKTQLTESKGTLAQRKIYRKFLISFMKKCPYISNFSIHKAVGSANNHKVVWEYNVNNWKDITKFYGWISKNIDSKKESGLAKALTPYAPNYNIGGKIHVVNLKGATLAKR